MNHKYLKQIITVTLWEYKRFFKLRNELLGILFLALLGFAGGGIGTFFGRESNEKTEITIFENASDELRNSLAGSFIINEISPDEKNRFTESMKLEKEGMLLWQTKDDFALLAYKEPKNINMLQNSLNEYRMIRALDEKNISWEDFGYVMQPATIESEYIFQPQSRDRKILAGFFAGLMFIGVFLGFAYQFTGITGEKQLKITEQIVSAIKPQVWMDGKILGITLTGLSSMLTYLVIGSLVAAIYFQFTGASAARILSILHLPSIILFFAFTMMGILMWNSIMAALASAITDPNNSGKSSVMMIPSLFAAAAILVMIEPDNTLAVFLSWFPLTSASAMPMRWVSTEVGWWQLPGSFLLLCVTFYFLRKLAAKIFRISILISGKEPTWTEIFKMIRED